MQGNSHLHGTFSVRHEYIRMDGMKSTKSTKKFKKMIEQVHAACSNSRVFDQFADRIALRGELFLVFCHDVALVH